MLACYVGVTTLFLDMFRPVHAGMSRMAAAFSLIGIAVPAADTLLPLATTPYLACKIHGEGYGVTLVFFGVYRLLPVFGTRRLGTTTRTAAPAPTGTIA